MPSQSGGGLTFSHTLDQEVHRLEQVEGLLDEVADEILQATGIQVLSWMQQDYRTKARGGTDPAGVKWSPIKRASMRSRLSKLQRYRNANRAAKQQQITSALGAYEIGVDTGRLINSLEISTGRADTEFTVSGRSVTVGTVVHYGKHYDRTRPIFSERNITPARLRELEDMAGDIVRENAERLT